ncbi:MAG TPA: hypothetical protein VIL84_12490 [Devosiaceae bacterium]
MSEVSPLSELAGFVARSPLAAEQGEVRRAAMAAIARGLGPQPTRRKVSDLLGVVMALSARTRRMVQPPVEIDLDVFAPGGRRAVRMVMSRRH